MELNSPRKDPYSPANKGRETLRDQGYAENFTVKDEKSIADENGNSYAPDDVMIDQILRFDGQKDWLENKGQRNEEVHLYALNANNGVKGIVERNARDNHRAVIDRFLQQVDRHDNLKENYN